MNDLCLKQSQVLKASEAQPIPKFPLSTPLVASWDPKHTLFIGLRHAFLRGGVNPKCELYGDPESMRNVLVWRK